MNCNKNCPFFREYPEGHSLHGMGVGFCKEEKDFVNEGARCVIPLNPPLEKGEDECPR